MSTTRLAEIERKRLAECVELGTLTCAEALERAYHLGVECERLDAMHRACEEYSRARAARDEVFRTDARRSSRPPKASP